MFLASLLRRIAFSYYDYKAYNFNIEKTDFVVIHIPGPDWRCYGHLSCYSGA